MPGRAPKTANLYISHILAKLGVTTAARLPLLPIAEMRAGPGQRRAAQRISEIGMLARAYARCADAPMNGMLPLPAAKGTGTRYRCGRAPDPSA